MMLIKLVDGVPTGAPVTEENFRYLHPTVSFPLILGNELVAPYGYEMWDFSQVPPVGTYQKLQELPPVKGVGGIWRQQWALVDLAGAELTAKQAAVEAARVASLWAAAHAVEYSAISGSAIGLITMGVLQAKPKCLAVQGWIHALWSEYYTRKGNGSTDYDFTTYAACPHTVPELMTELGF
jgi:hypothetical protein